ncbi:protein of unknown function [Azospirillum baldaniorum]|uniref:Uncharacterized protein n=1 Tax=Azospirillum baldaniorum TaxID=1064539 RepID=A0A9P1JQQ5_9PROT|nr:protein of unknown function [Azospirillum baldaniorum]
MRGSGEGWVGFVIPQDSVPPGAEKIVQAIGVRKRFPTMFNRIKPVTRQPSLVSIRIAG